MRILNFGFFHLDDVYIDALKRMPETSGADFDNIRTRTYLPIIDNASAPSEVYSLVKAAFDVAKPNAEDIVIVSGTPDVVNIISRIVEPSGARVICPLGKISQGTFQLIGFRELINTVDDVDSFNNAIFFLL